MAIKSVQNHRQISSGTSATDKKLRKRKAGLGNLIQGLDIQHDTSPVDVRLDVEREHSSKPFRKLSSTLRLRSQMSLRSAKAERFNYQIISVTDHERELKDDDSDDDDNDNEKEKEKEEQKEKQLQIQQKLFKINETKMGLVKRKFTLCLESEQRDLDSRGSVLPRFSVKSNSRFCDRAIFMKSTDLSKHFCDILGPGMCTDCTRTRKQQASVEDFVENFPEISVSPYMLCVPSENDVTKPKTPTHVYKNCDMFRKRSTSRMSSYDIAKNTSPTRPNSSSLYGYPLPSSRTSSPWPQSPTNFTQGFPQRHLNTPNSLSSRPSSRRSSIARYIDSKSDDCKHLKAFSESESSNHGNECQENQEVRTIKSVRITTSPKKINTKPTIERQSSDLHQNVFHKAISARTNGGTSGAKSARTMAIERRGKLSELPYWRFLIPEPPVMEVGRMNVSIYTPKDIPGIKIFDDSLFDISVMH